VQQSEFLKHLSNISRVDLKMFNGHLKRNIYIRRRKSIIPQSISLVLHFGTSSACAFYFISRITFATLMHFIIKELEAIINIVTNLQYINLVLILKQRFIRLNYMLSGSLNIDDVVRHQRSSIVTIVRDKIISSTSCNYSKFISNNLPRII
jgi:hypothetical protein